MKTIRTPKGKIMRVKDEVGRAMVRGDGIYSKGDYSFCGKEEWKKEVRGPIKKNEAAKKEETDAEV